MVSKESQCWNLQSDINSPFKQNNKEKVKEKRKSKLHIITPGNTIFPNYFKSPPTDSQLMG